MAGTDSSQGSSTPGMTLLVIKNPTRSDGFPLEVALDATVREVQGLIAQTYPGNPAIDEQTLIYAGKVLKDPTIRVRQLVAKTDSLNGPHSIHIVVKRREAGTGPSFAAQPAPSTPEPVLQTSSEASSSTAAGNPSPSTAVPTVAPPLADDGEQAIDEEVDSWVRQVEALLGMHLPRMDPATSTAAAAAIPAAYPGALLPGAALPFMTPAPALPPMMYFNPIVSTAYQAAYFAALAAGLSTQQQQVPGTSAEAASDLQAAAGTATDGLSSAATSSAGTAGSAPEQQAASAGASSAAVTSGNQGEPSTGAQASGSTPEAAAPSGTQPTSTSAVPVATSSTPGGISGTTGLTPEAAAALRQQLLSMMVLPPYAGAPGVGAVANPAMLGLPGAYPGPYGSLGYPMGGYLNPWQSPYGLPGYPGLAPQGPTSQGQQHQQHPPSALYVNPYMAAYNAAYGAPPPAAAGSTSYIVVRGPGSGGGGAVAAGAAYGGAAGDRGLRNILQAAAGAAGEGLRQRRNAAAAAMAQGAAGRAADGRPLRRQRVFTLRISTRQLLQIIVFCMVLYQHFTWQRLLALALIGLAFWVTSLPPLRNFMARMQVGAPAPAAVAAPQGAAGGNAGQAAGVGEGGAQPAAGGPAAQGAAAAQPGGQEQAQQGGAAPGAAAAAGPQQAAPARRGILAEVALILIGFFTSILPSWNHNADDAAVFAAAQEAANREAQRQAQGQQGQGQGQANAAGDAEGRNRGQDEQQQPREAGAVGA